jgi:hypothetical protein
MPTEPSPGGAGRPPISQRPSGSVASDAFAVPAKAEETKGALEPRRCDCSTRYEQSLDPVKPEAGVARPLVDLDLRQAFVAEHCFQHGALHSAHAADPQPADGGVQMGDPAPRSCERGHTPLTFSVAP